jgi:hypothetical protein
MYGERSVGIGAGVGSGVFGRAADCVMWIHALADKPPPPPPRLLLLLLLLRAAPPRAEEAEPDIDSDLDRASALLLADPPPPPSFSQQDRANWKLSLLVF